MLISGVLVFFRKTEIKRLNVTKYISPSYGLGTTPGCSVLIARSALQVHFYKLTSKHDAGIVIKRLSTITFVINGQLIEAPAEDRFADLKKVKSFFR